MGQFFQLSYMLENFHNKMLKNAKLRLQLIEAENYLEVFWLECFLNSR